MSSCSSNHSTMFRGSNKNRSSPYKEGIWRNGDCHDVWLRVLNFTHPERCAVTRSWSYKGTTHPELHLKTVAGDQLPVQDCGCTQVQLDQWKVKHNCCGGQISGTSNSRSRFSAKEWVDISTVRSSSELDTTLSKIMHTPVLPAAFHPAQRREAQVMAIANTLAIPSQPRECP